MLLDERELVTCRVEWLLKQSSEASLLLLLDSWKGPIHERAAYNEKHHGISCRGSAMSCGELPQFTAASELYASAGHIC